ncbi:MAG TPA: uroporphyrinogen-III C-methyltransferase [Accumulibacter sp.]|nr:uroporphyrinogen-III C-methyltransferase [Accumulibacter sp.]HMW17232.1 uroporphyrinogen-III C-methyltransferase [Accumulibacter sp.]HMX23419.1 uroporphyrinogen-III C-methyltransferase [Accumulibacter sp.]HMY07383.1 uroporphyrinogen-III C-methyltransferase [Accumulibacter sp.]HNC18497.1 uroporphyrinogen-III C-methyltransferase [Accumulibacter sp.]
MRSANTCPGTVFLVGAGPGDPDLLTLRAARLLAEADVVVYDRLVSPEILALIPPATERVYAGKQASRHTLPQPEINRRLIELAGRYRKVLRLKGGDPFIFGRGGEELAALVAAGIPFAVVPGITAGVGCAASTGIPLTHRDFASVVSFVTGHRQHEALDLDWPALARHGQTLVFYMGARELPEICRRLIAHGLPETTPLAVIQQGTTPRQQVVESTLAAAERHNPLPDATETGLIIVGEVVGLRRRLVPTTVDTLTT